MTKQTDTQQLIHSIADRVCLESGAFVVDISLTGTPRKRVIDIRVQTDEGIKSQECVEIARRINEELGDQDLFDSPWDIQVGSPGIGFKIRNWRALKSQTGRLVLVTFKATDRPVLKGHLKSIEPSGMILEIRKDRKQPAELVTVDFEATDHVVVDIEW